jgi:hypothetical protein
VASNLSRFQRWIKGLVGWIAVPQKIEITVQTDRLVIIRRRSWRRAWCQQCGREVDAVSLQEAKGLAGTVPPLLPRDAQLEAWHVCASGDGEQLVCLQSLLRAG